MSAITSVLTMDLIAASRAAAWQDGKPLTTTLESQSGLNPEAFVEELAKLFGYKPHTMLDIRGAEAAFDLISFAECMQRNVVVIRRDATVTVILTDPFDSATETWALNKVAQPTLIALAHRNDVSAYLAQQEEHLQAMHAIVEDVDVGAAAEAVEDISLTRISENASPVIKLVNSTIYDALKLQASDIHLECDAAGLYIKYRIDGVLSQVAQVNGIESAEQVISRIKVMAELDIAERRIPQDGRFKVRISGREIDFRVSVMPNIFGEDAVLRLLDRRALTEEAQSLRLDNLGLDAPTMAAIRRLAAKPHGMLLATGPTGSGKTTTLYAAITEINTGRDKIITIEDPVEYRLPRVLQIPVNDKKGLTFARGLRSILRHDPDKVMVGEIRDDETAQIAVQAALTGHLVFTSVHANNVFDVLGRFLHMGVDPYSFAAALNGIVAQRLLRLICSSCKREHSPSSDELTSAGLKASDIHAWRLVVGEGCGACRGTGYKGRRAVAEVLIVDDELREMIATKAPTSRLRAQATAAGMRSLRDCALEWAARGETTLAEVIRVVG